MALAPVTVEFHHPGLLYSTLWAVLRGPVGTRVPCLRHVAFQKLLQYSVSRLASTAKRHAAHMRQYFLSRTAADSPRGSEVLHQPLLPWSSACATATGFPADVTADLRHWAGEGESANSKCLAKGSDRDRPRTTQKRAASGCALPAASRCAFTERCQCYSTVRGSRHPRRRSARGRRARPILGREVDVARGATLARARPRPKTDQPACLVAK
jgi:hypothetical protein